MRARSHVANTAQLPMHAVPNSRCESRAVLIEYKQLMGEHFLTARACAMTEATGAVYACPDRGSAARGIDRLTS